MTDLNKAKLRRLAEDLARKEWGIDGSYVCTVKREGETIYVESWNALADCISPEVTKFVAAANPAAVLSLLDEREKLQWLIDSRWRPEHERIQAERDAALAELDQLRKDASAEMFVTLTSELAAQRAELEACRKDAERYRWLRARPTMTQPIVVRDRVSHLFLELMDKTIDAAMSQEANHA